MLPLVIDAHIIKAFFEEDQIGSDTQCTARATDVVTQLGRSRRAYVDAGGKIEQEWRGVTEVEWFVAWYSSALAAGAVEMIDATAKPELIKKLYTKWGFPHTSKDRYYIFTACAAAESDGKGAVLLSEDLDFYEPREKGCDSKRRLKILERQGGKVAKYLKRYENVFVRPVIGHLQMAAVDADVDTPE